MKVTRIANVSCMLLSLTVFSLSPARPALSAQASDQLGAIRAACAEDVQKLCGTVQAGGGRALACLKDHKDSLSDRCRQAAGLPAKPNSTSAPDSTGSPATPPATTPPVSSEDSHAKPAPAAKATTAPVAILGERFVQRSVIDTQQGGMTAVTVHVPESWHFDSKIEWHYEWIEVPVNPSWHAENPANAEAYFQYESLRLINVDVAPQYRQYVQPAKPGERSPTGQLTSHRSLRCKPWSRSSKRFAAM